MAGPTGDAGDVAKDESPQLDHVGVLVRDLELAAEQWQRRFDLSITSTFEAPALNIRATFLALGSSTIELFTIDEPEALNRELGTTAARIDHVALRFGQALGDRHLRGCTIRGPGRPDPIDEPFHIAGSDHVWTEPPGIDVLLQLIAPAATRP